MRRLLTSHKILIIINVRVDIYEVTIGNNIKNHFYVINVRVNINEVAATTATDFSKGITRQFIPIQDINELKTENLHISEIIFFRY